MWSSIQAPGEWLVFLQRTDIKGLPIMEARKRYMQEQLLFENYLSHLNTLNTVNIAGAGAGAAGGTLPSPGRIPGGSEKYIYHSNNINSLSSYSDASLPFTSFTTDTQYASNYVKTTTYDSGWTIDQTMYAYSTIDQPPFNATWQDLFGNVGQPLPKQIVGGQSDSMTIQFPSSTPYDDFIPEFASWRIRPWYNMGDIIDSIIPGLGTSTSRTRSLYWSVDYYTSITNIDPILAGGNYGTANNFGPYVAFSSPGTYSGGGLRYLNAPIFDGVPLYARGLSTATYDPTVRDRFGVWNSTPVHKISDTVSLNDSTRHWGWTSVTGDNPTDPTKKSWWRPGDVVFAFKNFRIGYLEAFTDNENITQADIYDDVTRADRGRAIKHI